jgi:hypothetical protein
MVKCNARPAMEICNTQSVGEMGDSRTVSLGFTYRFSKGNIASQKRRTGIANEMQDIIGIKQ